MIGREGATAILRKAIDFSDAEQTQAVLIGGESALTRLAENVIHQNVAESDARLTVKAVFGRKIGTASGNDLSDEGVRRTAARACEIARINREDRRFVSLPAPTGDAYPQVRCFSERTAAFGAAKRAAAAGIFAAEARSAGFRAAGSLGVQAGEIAIANSLGVLAYSPHTRVEASTVVMSGAGAGYAGDSAVDVDDISFAEMARTAVQKCRDSLNAAALPPGDYEVVLEPEAVGAMLLFAIRVGFHHVLYRQGGSYLSRKLGRRVLGDNVTIWDDGTDPRGLPMPFDFEGTPKRKLMLFENGVFRNMVYDSYTAGEAGAKTTGHSIPYADFGAMPMNVFVQPGGASIQDMIKSTERGILVTRFHYTNLVRPGKVVITGMTRDGTFLIEGGKVKGPVMNMRFTQSVLEALRCVEMVGSEPRRLGMANVPAMKIGKFSFTGATEY
ncbi:MAG: TldD/PmbA family protein [Bacillota bacterium]|nr:TldD/PmbA family protein [Bacillota bacterium]